MRLEAVKEYNSVPLPYSKKSFLRPAQVHRSAQWPDAFVSRLFTSNYMSWIDLPNSTFILSIPPFFRLRLVSHHFMFQCVSICASQRFWSSLPLLRLFCVIIVGHSGPHRCRNEEIYSFVWSSGNVIITNIDIYLSTSQTPNTYFHRTSIYFLPFTDSRQAFNYTKLQREVSTYN